MANSRYIFNPKVSNNSVIYQEILKEKNIKKIIHNSTSNFKDILPFSQDFRTVNYIWKASDRLTNLSQKFYDTPKYWYLIALTNKISNEFEIAEGQLLTIYFPLDSILSFYGLI